MFANCTVMVVITGEAPGVTVGGENVYVAPTRALLALSVMGAEKLLLAGARLKGKIAVPPGTAVSVGVPPEAAAMLRVKSCGPLLVTTTMADALDRPELLAVTV